MKASQFSDAQKAFILRQGADGVPVADICRKAGISQATYFNWKRKYEGMQPPEMRRLKQRGREREKLKKDRGGPVVGSRDASGRHSPKTVRPARKRELATRRFVMNGACRSGGRAASSNSIVRPLPLQIPSSPEQAGVEARIKEICQDARPLRVPARPCPPASRRAGRST